MFESDEDRLASIKALGGQLVNGPEEAFWAIFDNGYFEASQNGGIGVETLQPTLTARTIDVEELTRDTPLQIDGKQYLLKKHQPDGTGMSTVMLKA